jgi:hypothetical protein
VSPLAVPVLLEIDQELVNKRGVAEAGAGRSRCAEGARR